MRKIAIAAGAAYLMLLHAIVTIALFRPELISDQRWRLGAPSPESQSYIHSLQGYFLAQDTNAASGRVVLIGDSHFQRMDVSGLALPALNFGAGGDTVRNMIDRSAEYQSLSRSRAVVIWGGINDLQRRSPALVSADMKQLMEISGDHAPVFVLSIPPVFVTRFAPEMNGRIDETNSLYAASCHSPCTYIDVHSLLADSDGGLSPAFDSGDGLHLNARGYEVVTAALSNALTAAP